MSFNVVATLKKEGILCWSLPSAKQSIQVYSPCRKFVVEFKLTPEELLLVLNFEQTQQPVALTRENAKFTLLGQKSKNKLDGYIALSDNLTPLLNKVLDHNYFNDAIVSEVNSLLVVIDKQGTIIKVNKAFEDLCGISEAELIGKNAQRLFMSPAEAEKSLKRIATLYKENEKIEVIRPVIVNGKEHQIFWKNVLIKDKVKNTQYIICAGTDISKQLESNRKLEEISKQDALTGLWNRSALKEKTKECILRGVPFNLLFLDFNEFKLINDSYGHSTGDTLLINFATKLKQSNLFSYVSRLGGDEFVLLHEGTPDSLNQAIYDLLRLLDAPLIEKPALKVKFSAGVVHYPQHGTCFEDLFRRADLAMYRAKKMGLNSFIFEDTLEADALKLGWLEENFEKALEKDEFFIVLQPKFDTNTKEIVGAESLVRWYSSVANKLIYPDEFIPFAEKYGYIHKLGEKVLELSCIELQKLQLQGLAVPVSVNISAKQFESELLLDKIFNYLTKYNIPANLLEIELTETAVAKNSKLLKKILSVLRMSGIKINLDDFGKGESSLFLLSDIELDTLKIDKSFIDKIHTPKGYALIKGIVLAASGLSLNLVAEGIETVDQKELIHTLGIKVGQGYWFSKPVLPLIFNDMLLAQKDLNAIVELKN